LWFWLINVSISRLSIRFLQLEFDGGYPTEKEWQPLRSILIFQLSDGTSISLVHSSDGGSHKVTRPTRMVAKFRLLSEEAVYAGNCTRFPSPPPQPPT
jgi:hypothetical protein